MAETYPWTLPQPEHVGYAGAIGYGLVQTNLSGPIANQQEYFNSPTTTLSVTWAMDDATYATWLAWIKANAYDWFYLPIVSPRAPVNITSNHLVRAISPVDMGLNGDNWQRVSLTIELIPGAAEDPLAPAPVYDFIDAGTPAAPSVDIIDAGTPASPSPDLIEAALYYY